MRDTEELKKLILKIQTMEVENYSIKIVRTLFDKEKKRIKSEQTNFIEVNKNILKVREIMEKQIKKINLMKSIKKSGGIMVCLYLFLFFIVGAVMSVDSLAEQVRTTNFLTFQWDAVTKNADGTPCDDLAGYALYRSRESKNWDGMIGKDKAYRIITAQQTEYGCWCKEPGSWFWIMRAFDTTHQYSDESNEVESFVDLNAPGKIINLKFQIQINIETVVEPN